MGSCSLWGGGQSRHFFFSSTPFMQYRCTYRRTSIWRFPYERRLELLGAPSLVHLRSRTNLVLVYNILDGKVILPIEELFETPASPNLRGHRHLQTSPSAVPFSTPQVCCSTKYCRIKCLSWGWDLFIVSFHARTVLNLSWNLDVCPLFRYRKATKRFFHNIIEGTKDYMS